MHSTPERRPLAKRTSGARALLCVAVALAAVLATAVAHAGERQKLTLSGFAAPGLIDAALDRLRPAYDELGIDLHVVVTTPSRALVDAVSGRTDGEVVRAEMIGEIYPTLKRVEVPLMTLSTYAYTLRADLAALPREELGEHRAGFVRGAVFAEQISHEFKETWTAESLEQLFTMLAQNRIDMVIAVEKPALAMIRQTGLSDRVTAIPSSRRDYMFYHYLNIRNAALASRLEEVLRRHASRPGGTPGKKID